jgi:hypothetical protein
MPDGQLRFDQIARPRRKQTRHLGKRPTLRGETRLPEGERQTQWYGPASAAGGWRYRQRRKLLMEGLRSTVAWKVQGNDFSRKLSTLRFIVRSFQGHLAGRDKELPWFSAFRSSSLAPGKVRIGQALAFPVSRGTISGGSSRMTK